MYIYYFEAGQIEQHPEHPTRIDLLGIESGVLIVLKVQTGGQICEIDSNGQEIPLPVCDLDKCDNGEAYHYPSSEVPI